MSDSEDYNRIGAAAAHAKSHELGGADAINHSALVAHNHAPRHELGGPDVINVSGLTGLAKYVDRGDPAGPDFAVGDITTDGTEQILDLSGIVPAGAIAVHLRVLLFDDLVGTYVFFGKNGNSNLMNVGFCRIMVTVETHHFDIIVACDTDRKIEYTASNTNIGTLDIIIRGWFV